MKKFLYIFVIFLTNILFGQQNPNSDDLGVKDSLSIGKEYQKQEEIDNLSDSLKVFIPTINDYKVFKSNLDTINILKDFSIQDFYNKNSTGKDYFGKMNPNNIGNSFNELSYFRQEQVISNLLPVGKINYFISENEVRYFDVKTPTTEFDYESGVKEGQALSSLLTHSPNSRINYSIQYRGLRSLGRYQSEFASNNYFILGFSLRNKKNNYKVLTHYAIQNIDNQENGGIANREQFDSNNPLFNTRSTISVNLEGVNSKLKSKRFYIKQILSPFNSSNKLKAFEFSNSLTLEENNYSYSESTINSFFTSNTINGSDRSTQNKQFNIENRLGVAFKNKRSTSAEVGYLYNQINYNLLIRNDSIHAQINNSFNGVYSNFTTKILNTLNFKSDFQYSLNTIFQNPHQLKVDLNSDKEKQIQLFATYLNQSSIPRLNTILSQSFYQDYNFYNPNFKNENLETITVGLKLKSINTSISSSINKIQNHIYFDENNLSKQLDSKIELFTIDFLNELKYKKINLVSNLRYQKIDENQDILPLPTLIARTSLFYQSNAFKKAAEIQTGFNLNYFSAFKSREISPLNNEFKLQNSSKIYSIGNTPMLDYFFNLKARRLVFYFKLENISSFFTSSYYVLPNVPYTDFRIRLGIKWYLFS